MRVHRGECACTVAPTNVDNKMLVVMIYRFSLSKVFIKIKHMSCVYRDEYRDFVLTVFLEATFFLVFCYFILFSISEPTITN